jgi:hypothetical protein
MQWEKDLCMSWLDRGSGARKVTRPQTNRLSLPTTTHLAALAALAACAPIAAPGIASARAARTTVLCCALCSNFQGLGVAIFRALRSADVGEDHIQQTLEHEAGACVNRAETSFRNADTRGYTPSPLIQVESTRVKRSFWRDGHSTHLPLACEKFRNAVF